jgi:hypothetical protein
MESTSIKNMIQVSSDTAKYLRDSGTEGMLIPREGLVKAKGKGYMQVRAVIKKIFVSNLSQ